MAQPLRATLDEITSTVPISALQSASIACEVASRLDRWLRAKRPAGIVVPALHDLIIAQSGSIWWWRGRSVASSQVIPALGALLNAMLQHTPAGRTPAGLLYVVARATEPTHLAPFRDLAEFHAAIARYGADRRHLAIDALVARYQIARSGLSPLCEESSISDVRRLRRAGGVPLAQIACDTGIPLSALRELEWGVYTNWDLAYATGALARYAERAGLDPEAVTQVLLREQALATASCFDITIEADPAERSLPFLPFALATALLAALFIATPGDREPQSPVPVRVGERTAVVPQAPLPVLSPAGAPQPPTTTPRDARVRTTPPASRRTSALARQSHPSARRAEPAPRPLVRLARALIGDGRYRAEPFPKPR